MDHTDLLHQIPAITEFDLEWAALAEPAREPYCQQRLRTIAEDAHMGAPEFALSAYVRVRLANLLARGRRSASKVEHVLNQAVEDANRSESSIVKYETYFAAGNLMAIIDLDAAIVHLQRALLCADPRVPEQFIRVMWTLGDLWAVSPTTYQRALLMYDWVCLASPAPIFYLLSKYQCMIRNGDVEMVKQEASLPLTEDCSAVGRIVAARVACRRVKAAQKAAEYGLDLARKLRQPDWERAFRTYVPPDSPGKASFPSDYEINSWRSDQ